MARFVARDLVAFGFGLWLFGYALGVVFFAFVPPAMIGWYVAPIGVAATVFTLWTWVGIPSPGQGMVVGIVWNLIAVVGERSASY